MKEEYSSARFEPAHQDRKFERDPAEWRASRTNVGGDEISAIRDSVFDEPAMGSDGRRPDLGEWIERKRAECSIAGNLGVAFLAALLAGPFAIVGAFMVGTKGTYGLIYVVSFGPVIEEFLKQSGMIYLVEKKPYRVFAAWQFVFSAVVAALLFATIENLLYIHVYVRPETLVQPEAFIRYRWIVCTTLHVVCSVIASFGMIRVWKKQLADGRMADLSAAFVYFIVAMVIHCLYNLAAVLFSDYFFEQTEAFIR